MASAESAALADQKRTLRRAMGEERSRLTAEQRARAASGVASRLASLPEVRAAISRGDYLAGFSATRGEIDPAGALAEAQGQGAKLAFPRVAGGAGSPTSAAATAAAEGEGARLRFHLARPEQLTPGRFGILEPPPACPEIASGAVAVMLVPGLAFDAQGNRLGFGGGYYDEVLGSAGAPAGAAPAGRPAFVVGVGYDFQVVASCPVDERDGRVDCVVTDARVIRCNERAPMAAAPAATEAFAAPAASGSRKGVR